VSWSPRQAPLPGYVCLVARRHVIEPYDLPGAEQQAFFADAMRAARAVAQVVRPVRVNYEIHGKRQPGLRRPPREAFCAAVRWERAQIYRATIYLCDVRRGNHDARRGG
jgi:hypothetical protein